MPIINAKNHIEVYRAKARAKDISELSGRCRGRNLTLYINEQIKAALDLSAADVLVDIGCGDGSLLRDTHTLLERAYGIVPTADERLRLTQAYSLHNIAFVEGLAQKIPLADALATKIVCNGVLILLDSVTEVNQALREISRIAAPDALIWIGELPELDEFSTANKTYGDSIIKWLFFVLRRQGLAGFANALSAIARSLLTAEPFIIQPKKHFIINPQEFIGLAERHGLRLVTHGRHKELDAQNNPVLSTSRNDFLFKKTAR